MCRWTKPETRGCNQLFHPWFLTVQFQSKYLMIVALLLNVVGDVRLGTHKGLTATHKEVCSNLPSKTFYVVMWHYKCIYSRLFQGVQHDITWKLGKSYSVQRSFLTVYMVCNKQNNYEHVSILNFSSGSKQHGIHVCMFELLFKLLIIKCELVFLLFTVIKANHSTMHAAYATSKCLIVVLFVTDCQFAR